MSDLRPFRAPDSAPGAALPARQRATVVAPGAVHTALIMLLMGLAPSALAAQSAPPSLVDGYRGYVELLLGVTFSPAQRDTLRTFADGYWRARATPAMRVVERGASMWTQLTGVPDAVRQTTVATTRGDVLVALDQAAREGDAESRWLLAVYRAQHPPLAEGRPGAPPLTREVMDAQLELHRFNEVEIHRRSMPPIDAAARAAAYRDGARRYPTLTVAQQRALATVAGEWASTRGQWAILGPELRLLVRESLGARLTGDERLALEGIRQMGRQHQQQVLGSALAHMRETSELVMGRGTTWNAARGRWEQQGGIVTEFNGTVRVP
jgi:hypothetical protein